MMIGFCGTCMEWTVTRMGMQWHCGAGQWCCDGCYARENGVALWFWA